MSGDEKSEIVLAITASDGGITLTPCRRISTTKDFRPISQEELAEVSPEWFLALSLLEAQGRVTENVPRLPPAQRTLTVSLLQAAISTIGTPGELGVTYGPPEE